MIRYFMLFFIVIFAYSEDLKIMSKFFTYDPDKNITIFKKDVNITKKSDNILSDNLVVFFNANKKPYKFIATNNVRFNIVMDKNTTYKGKCDKLIYFFKRGDIILIGNASILKKETNESIKGDKIVINRIKKSAKVIGKNTPVEIILKVNE